MKNKHIPQTDKAKGLYSFKYESDEFLQFENVTTTVVKNNIYITANANNLTVGTAAEATNATNATNVTTAADTGNAEHFVTFTDSAAATQQLKTDSRTCPKESFILALTIISSNKWKL